MTSYDDLIDDENQMNPSQLHPDEGPQPVDAPHPAHPVEEDPEDHIGDEMPDPWTDASQGDWPNAHVADDTYTEPEQTETPWEDPEPPRHSLDESKKDDA